MKRFLYFGFLLSTIVFLFNSTSLLSQYCSVQGYYPQYGYMTRFVFNGIDNRSSYNSTGYSDYTSIKSNPCLPGQSYSFTVDGYSIWNCTGYVIWVDWNQDGSFNNSDELVAYKWESCRRNWTKTYTSQFTIPTYARLGETRMRVAYTGHHYYAQTLLYYGACYSYYYMEWEDYTIVIGMKRNDAGITDITSPVSKFNSYQNQPVRVVLKNFGKYFPLTSVAINWSVNGVEQTPYQWSGYLDTGATTEVEIHSSFKFTPQAPWGPFVVRAWTSNPRGTDPNANTQPDGDPTNDSYTKNIPCILNDAGVISAEPMLPLNPGINTVAFRIKNYAPKPLSSVYINWSVYGQPQSPFYWTGNLASQDSIDVVVGSYDFGTANIPIPITAWTSYPNGLPDEDITNDTLTTQVYKALAGGTYSIGGRDPDFVNLIDFTSFISYWGIAGPVIIIFRPGTYEANVTLKPVGNRQYPITFKSLSGRKEDVVIEANPNSLSGNFVIELDGYNNITFQDVTLKNNSCNYGCVLSLKNNIRNLTIENCELIGCQSPPKTSNFALIYSENNYVENLHISNTLFRYGSVGIWQISPSNNFSRNINIEESFFINQNWQGLHIENAHGCFIKNNNVAGVNLESGIFVRNGSFIQGNRVSGVGPASSTTINDNNGGICVIHTQTGFEGATVEENVVMTTNSNGIYVSGVNAFNINKNQLTTNATGIYDKAAIVLINSGYEFNNYIAGSFLADNFIIGTNTHGIYASGSKSVKIYRNYVKLNGNNKYALYLINTPSLVGNNLITTKNASALQINNLGGTMLLYNTFYSNTSGSCAELSQLKTQNIFKRNMFINEGTGYAIQLTGAVPSDLIMDENNIFSNGSNLTNFGATLSNWQNATGVDLNSSSVKPVFLSPDNPRINKIDANLYLKSPLPELMGTNWQDEVENNDIDGNRRFKAFYKGANNLNPEIRILEQPKEVVGCVGQDGYYLSVTAEIDFGGELYFQWYFNGLPVEGATDPILMLPPLTHEMAGIYHCVVSGNGEADPVRSQDALLYAIRPTKITRQPEVEYAEPGDVVSFQIDMHITPEEQQYNQPIIQWYRGNTPLSDNDRIAGSNSSILTIRDIKPIDFATNYYVIVHGLCGSDTSSFITIAQKPKVIIQPLTDIEACKGEDVQLTVNAVSTVPGYTLNYQWRFNGTPITDNSKYTGTNTETLTINSIDISDAGSYDVVVSITGFDQAISNEATLFVVLPPTIVQDLPQSLDIAQGSEIRLSITAAGDNLSYQWYKDGNEIPFTDNEIVISSATTDDAGTYKVKVYNQCGEVWSSECVVTVTYKTILKGETGSWNLELYQNNPNPFDSYTRIEFTLPESKLARFNIWNPFGEAVLTIEKSFPTGSNFIDVNAGELKLTPGLYYYTLEVDWKRLIRKMIFIH